MGARESRVATPEKFSGKAGETLAAIFSVRLGVKSVAGERSFFPGQKKMSEKPTKKAMGKSHHLGCTADHFLAHERHENVGYLDRPIGLLIVFDDGGQKAWSGGDGIVDGVNIFQLAGFAAVTDIETPGLEIVEIRVGVGLAVFALTGEPGLDVVFAPLARAHVAGAHQQDVIWQFEGLEQFFGVSENGVVHFAGHFFIGDGVDDLLDLVKLMEAENTFGVLAVGADFATETGRDANHFDGEIFLIYHFVLEVGGDGDFGGADQALTVLSFVVIFLPPGKIAGAPHDVFIDQPGNGQGRKALENHVFEGVSKDGVFEKDEVVFGEESTAAGNPNRPFGVQNIEVLHDAVVSFWLGIKFWKIAPLFHFLIARFVL